MIYCVEDEQNICELEVYTLQSVGFEAKGCSSGKELFAELEKKLPKLILQPLVENAIIHGVADQNEGYIKITAWEGAGDLVLCVQDNGCGIPAETLEKLKSGGEPGKHLGLYNVNQILGLHYGERYGVRAESAPGRGSRVMVRLPLRIREEEIPC